MLSIATCQQIGNPIRTTVYDTQSCYLRYLIGITMTRFRSVPFLLISLAFLSPLVSGFTSCNQRFNGSRQSVSSQTRFTRCRVLMRNDLFDNFKKLWGGWADEDDQDGQRSGTVENEDDAAGTSLIASIPGE